MSFPERTTSSNRLNGLGLQTDSLLQLSFLSRFKREAQGRDGSMFKVTYCVVPVGEVKSDLLTYSPTDLLTYQKVTYQIFTL